MKLSRRPPLTLPSTRSLRSLPALSRSTLKTGCTTSNGLKPRSVPSFWAAANEAAISRLYGGIHYRAAIELGAAQGKCVAGYTVALKTWRQ